MDILIRVLILMTSNWRANGCEDCYRRIPRLRSSAKQWMARRHWNVSPDSSRISFSSTYKCQVVVAWKLPVQYRRRDPPIRLLQVFDHSRKEGTDLWANEMLLVSIRSIMVQLWSTKRSRVLFRVLSEPSVGRLFFYHVRIGMFFHGDNAGSNSVGDANIPSSASPTRCSSLL